MGSPEVGRTNGLKASFAHDLFPFDQKFWLGKWHFFGRILKTKSHFQMLGKLRWNRGNFGQNAPHFFDLSYEIIGGESGIRTRGTPFGVHSLSRRAP